MKVTFEFEKDTRNTIRFKEVLDGPLDVANISTLYVQKSTLKQLGYAEGQKLEVTLNVV
ncbi:MAG: hypothetical protein M0P69_19065 [Bacteroidales bacterium]|nr:hypothetical protein [Bacteroidales bacterium]